MRFSRLKGHFLGAPRARAFAQGITCNSYLGGVLSICGIFFCIWFAFPAGSTLADLLIRLEVQLNQDSILLVINGRQAQATQVLTDGDEVHLIPALSGGAPISDGRRHPAHPK